MRKIATGALLCAGVMGIALGASADPVYQQNFDGLTPGITQPAPGAAGQDQWQRVLGEEGGFGEIQGSIAHGGQALKQFTAATTPEDLQTIDHRQLGPLDLHGVGQIKLAADFYSSSSDLSALNPYTASLTVAGGPHPGYSIIGFDVGAGNGAAKSDNLAVTLGGFDGSNNNVPVAAVSGLAWDAWHHVEVLIDHAGDHYVSLTVDGTTLDLSGYQLARSFDNGVWRRGQLIEDLSAAITGHSWQTDSGVVRTDDSVHWDNIDISVTANPVPLPSAAWGGLALVGLLGASRVRTWQTSKTA